MYEIPSAMSQYINKEGTWSHKGLKATKMLHPIAT